MSTPLRCVLSFAGHHAGGALLLVRLQSSNRSLRQSDPSRQVLEGPQKHLHHRHVGGERGRVGLHGCGRGIVVRGRSIIDVFADFYAVTFVFDKLHIF